MTFSRILPLSFSALSIRFSTESNSAISLEAFFSPMPGIPGILSDASPQSPRMSITCSGRLIPYFSHTSLTPNIFAGSPPFAGLKINILSLTNCPKSLSGVIIYVVKPCFSAFFESVPIISSASYPSHSNIGILKPFIISFI